MTAIACGRRRARTAFDERQIGAFVGLRALAHHHRQNHEPSVDLGRRGLSGRPLPLAPHRLLASLAQLGRLPEVGG